ncbi:5-formyltetrahydrofolate cyclo-ligase [Rothia amarae]|uniref:5-formyltetrahydrofolate cyclo-ligase n=1 Tax=Rothia amarae TaxID=169480 RepID=UPI0033C67846
MMSPFSPSSAEEIAADKKLLRASIRARRVAALPHPPQWSKNFEQNMKDIVHEACQQLGQTHLTIAAYLPVDVEPPLIPGLTALSEAGHTILVPRVEPQRQLSWVQWTPETEFAKNSMGIEEPLGEKLDTQAFLDAHVHFVPALAYDVNGARLGQGGGYYDRFLTEETAKSPFTFGVVFAREILDALPTDTWDSHLEQVLTEEGITKLKS